jgi:hypothetical protein
MGTNARCQCFIHDPFQQGGLSEGHRSGYCERPLERRILASNMDTIFGSSPAEAHGTQFRIWRFQVSLWRWILFALLAARPSLQLLGQTATDPAKTAPSMGQELRDGEHDFDFNVGTWTTHIRRLLWFTK